LSTKVLLLNEMVAHEDERVSLLPRLDLLCWTRFRVGYVGHALRVGARNLLAVRVLNPTHEPIDGIVLKQTGVSANFQVLIDLDSNNDFFATITMSPNAGFGVGTTTTAPTAADGVPLFAGPAAWGVDSGVSIQYKLHFMQSTDGACSRAFICRYSNGVAGGVVSAYIAFEVPQNPVTGWTNPCIGQWIGTSGAGQQLNYTNTFNSAFVVGRGVSNMTMFLTGETATGNHALIADDYYSQNDFNGELLLMPLGLYSATAANRGRHGQLFDIWWGPGQFQAMPNIQFPGAADRAFTQFGVLVVPWNGTTCQMT
jgi:hypothetical protein